MSKESIGDLTPQRAALIWKHEPIEGTSGQIVILVPFGTARFRVLQAILFELLSNPATVARMGNIRPSRVVLKSTAAFAWELMNGYRTLGQIAHQIVVWADASDESSILNSLYNFCLQAHTKGILNIDFPRPPHEGYAHGLLEDLGREPLASAFLDPWLRGELVKAIKFYGEATGELLRE